MEKIYKIIFILLAFSIFVKGQNELQIFEKHFVKEKKILFRLSVPDRKTFDEIKNGPLKVTRFESQNGSLNNAFLLENLLMPYWEADTLNWLKLLRKDNNKAGFVYQALFQNKGDVKLSPEERAKQEKMIFDLLLLSCDFDSEIAKACGLFFIDSTINNNTKYVYKIDLHTSPITSKEVYSVSVNPAVLSVNKKINDLLGKSKNKISTIRWNALSYSDHYSGYNVERSEDSIHFKRLNKAPVILLSNQFEKNKEFIIYIDTMPTINKKYYYHIKGINFFGEESESSNMITNFNFPVISSVPLFDTVKVIQNKQISLKWRMEKKAETSLLKSYFLMRSETDNGKYISIYESKDKLMFIDLKPLPANFYKVGAITFNNDTLFSYSRMALIIDTIPPSSPLGLKATVDKKGNVTIQWHKNSEKDIQGYKLFKANAKTEEFVQINNKFITDTTYLDKLNLKTLSKKIYYSLAASDNNFNTSVNCIAIEVKRPDTIAPPAPVLNSVSSELNGAKLRFTLSKNEDIFKHTIVRKNESENTWQEIKLISLKDSISSFIDTTVKYEQVYSYLIKAYDEANNCSVSKCAALKYETGFRKKLTEINYLVDRTLKNISLTWSYKEIGIEKFILYRGNAKEALTIIKTMDGNILSFTDKTANIGNIYEYRIKAVLYNGAESIISDPIKITY